MRHIVVVGTVIAFCVMGTVVLAEQATTAKKKPAKEIWCCIDGTKCEKMTKEACKAAGGKQVSNCKSCTKPPSKSGPKATPNKPSSPQ